MNTTQFPQIDTIKGNHKFQEAYDLINFNQIDSDSTPDEDKEKSIQFLKELRDRFKEVLRVKFASDLSWHQVKLIFDRVWHDSLNSTDSDGLNFWNVQYDFIDLSEFARQLNNAK